MKRYNSQIRRLFDKFVPSPIGIYSGSIAKYDYCCCHYYPQLFGCRRRRWPDRGPFERTRVATGVFYLERINCTARGPIDRRPLSAERPPIVQHDAAGGRRRIAHRTLHRTPAGAARA